MKESVVAAQKVEDRGISKVMKYEIVSITAGVECVMLETSSIVKAQNAYRDLIIGGALVRVRVNGRMLKIYEADRSFYVTPGKSGRKEIDAT